MRMLAFAGVAGVAPLLFIGGPDWASGPFYRSVWNLGHIGLFALLTFGLKPWQWLAGWRLWVATTAAVLMLGILIELLQSGTDRQADWHDILRNLLGVWLVFAWRPVFSRDTGADARSWLLPVVTAMLLLFELGTTSAVAARQWQVNHQLPLLYDFRHENTAPFWSGNLAPSPRFTSNHPQSLKIELGTETYSGVSLDNLPADWRDYRQLTIMLFNPTQEPLTLTLRINDVAHDRGDNAYGDRFNTRLVLAPGANTFTINLDDVSNAPASRTMDMANVRRLGLFAVRLPAPRNVYLSDLELN
ncbi:succinyl-CoA synthetase subunit beta [Marinobacter sp. DUT-1]|uniref:succinyl-CoA synthetase subunit beta n=1 Tax=Marinobacter sp. DUT-1 TaxID=3412037 RepID=UPI003D172ED4